MQKDFLDSEQLDITWVAAIPFTLFLLWFFLIMDVQGAGRETGSLPGFFSAEQADHGKLLYEEHCASCHGADLQGAGAAGLKGESFLIKWSSAGKKPRGLCLCNPYDDASR